MKTALIRSLLVVAAGLFFAPLARADEGGWKMPNLNPFAKPSGPPTSGSLGSGLKMPKLWPSSKPAVAAPPMQSMLQPKEPSAWQKMQTSTRNFWSKTADAMNPFDDANDPIEAPMTGRNSAFSQATMQRPADQKKTNAMLPSWTWGPKEEPKQVRTVQDFLALPKPGDQ